ncbi:MAG: acetate uptake transporter [Methanoregula sp.]|uniref:acetate uptake transporter n=1 Tax=Methanoregula sp. TaxID=2052170 RepID=UPI003D118543
MSSEKMETMVTTRDLTGNPAPLGLMGFGMTTVLLNLQNAGLFTLGSIILAMGIFYGGIAQLIAGSMEWKKGNTFATTAFCSYGLFWLSLVALIMIPSMGLGEKTSPTAMAAYLAMWGLFTAVMFIGTLRFNRAMQVVFATLAILFFLLALGELTGNSAITQIAGWVGILCGFSAIYTALAQVVNETYGKGSMIVPLWPVK